MTDEQIKAVKEATDIILSMSDEELKKALTESEAGFWAKCFKDLNAFGTYLESVDYPEMNNDKRKGE